MSNVRLCKGPRPPAHTPPAAAARRTLYATDGPEVLDELRACASFGGGSRGKRPRLHSLIELAGIPTRGMSDASFARIWTEVEILVGAQVVVGTFSSNVGRLVRAGRALAALS